MPAFTNCTPATRLDPGKRFPGLFFGKPLRKMQATGHWLSKIPMQPSQYPLSLVEGVVFDLDDTLYLEREYVRSGFLYVASTLHGKGGVHQAEIFESLWGLFEVGIRPNTFDRL